jgi:hypothetical protein
MGTNSQFFKEVPVSMLNQVQFPSRPSPFLHQEFHGRAAPIQTGSAHPRFSGASDVLPYSSQSRTSAGSSTAWRLPRSGDTLPHPYSKNTFRSTYQFDS